MQRIRFLVKLGSATTYWDAALVGDGEDPLEQLEQSVVGSIATAVQVVLGGVQVNLAMLQDPEHWSEDWAERGIEDVDGFLAGLVTGEES
jgi:hypothetical protein